MEILEQRPKTEGISTVQNRIDGHVFGLVIQAGQVHLQPSAPTKLGTKTQRLALMFATIAISVIAAVGAAIFPSTPDPRANQVSRLAAPISATAWSLTIKITGVHVSADYTIVDLRAQNDGVTTAILSLGNAILNEEDGTSLSHAPTDASDWGGNVLPGKSSTGSIIFSKAISPSTTHISLGFAEVRGNAEHDSITVNHIALTSK